MHKTSARVALTLFTFSMAIIMGIQVLAREEVHHEGDLILDGSEGMLIKETDFVISGDILLSGTAQLVVQDSTLRFTSLDPTVWGGEANIELCGSANLNLVNSTIAVDPTAGADPIAIIFLTDQATLSMASSQFDGDTNSLVFCRGDARTYFYGANLGEIRLGDTSRADIQASTILWTVGLDFGGASEIALDRLVGGRISSRQLPERPDGFGPVAIILDSWVGGWSIEVAEGAQVRIADSELERMTLEMSGPTGAIRNLAPGMHHNWKLSEDAGTTASCELELDSTNIGGWSVHLSDVHGPLRLADSSLTSIRISNCSERIPFERVDVRALCVFGGGPVLSFDASSLALGIDIDESSLTITGDLAISPSSRFSHWENSTLTREMIVLVRSQDRSPVEGATVSWIDEMGVPHTQTTDPDGMCQMMVVFTDQNRLEPQTLDVTGPSGSIATKPITYLSSSPVIVVLESP